MFDALVGGLKPPLHRVVLLAARGVEPCFGEALGNYFAGIDALGVKTGFVNAKPSTGVDSR